MVIDSRAARVLQPDRRSILDDDEMAWLDGQLRGDVDHLFIGTSLPFFIAQGIHDLEAINESMAEGAWGPRVARWGEKMRRALDLEHWAAFQEGFAAVLEMVVQVAHGERGKAPGTITFLSGDVHNSYVTEIGQDQLGAGSSTILQAVCSPIRNPLPRQVRIAQAVPRQGSGPPAAVPREPHREGAQRAIPVARHARSVVRQQPRHPRGARSRAGDALGGRRGPGRRLRRPGPASGGKGLDHLTRCSWWAAV